MLILMIDINVDINIDINDIDISLLKLLVVTLL